MSLHHYILREVINDSRLPVTLPKELVGVVIKQVWTLIHEDTYKDVGLKHNVSTFLEDKYHDWRVKNDKLFFYGHSGARGDLHDLVIVYEVMDI